MKKQKRIWHVMLSAVMALALVMFPVPAEAAEDTVEVNNGMRFLWTTTNEDIERAWGAGTAKIESNADGSYTVTLLKNITLKKGASIPVTFGDYFVAEGADQPQMIFDLNGHTLSAQTIVLSNMGNLIVKDSVGTGKVIYNGGNYMVAAQNQGYRMVIEGGTFVCQGAGSASYNAAFSSASTTETIINGGTFQGNNAGAVIAHGNITVNGGVLEGAYGVVSKQAPSGNGKVVFPKNSSAQVKAEKMAFVVHGTGDQHGTIVAEGGNFDAPAIAGKIGTGDPQKDLTISGGTYAADPNAYVAAQAAVAGFGNEEGTDYQYVVGREAIAGRAKTAEEGTVIDVLSGDLELEVPADRVKITNKGTGTVTVNDQPLSDDQSIVTCVHTWGDPVWKWSEDKTEAQAVFSCTKNSQHVKTVKADVTSEKIAADENGREKIVYTAKVMLDGRTYTEQVTVEIPASGGQQDLSGQGSNGQGTVLAPKTEDESNHLVCLALVLCASSVAALLFLHKKEKA